MRILLDTHTLLWWLTDDIALSPEARALIADPENTVLVSVASAWEIAIKSTKGKLSGVDDLLNRFTEEMTIEDFGVLDISARHAVLAPRLRGEHGDPFDRMLAAQALVEELALVSRDTAMDQFAVPRIW